MPWHLITRLLFVAAVAWAASLTRPFHPSLEANVAIGALLGVVVVIAETRLRSAEVTDLLGALIGGAIGLGLAKTIGAALFWADTGDRRVVFLHSFIGKANGSSRRGWSTCSATSARRSATGSSTPA